MADTHRIAELLTQGVAPTEGESSDLAQVGQFVASMYGRYHAGLNLAQSEQLGTRSGQWVEDLEAGLSARTAERWAEGMGLSSFLLGGGWAGMWQQGLGQAFGYDAFDAELTALQLEEEEAMGAPDSPRPSSRRRGSLFGRRGPRRTVSRPRPKSGSREKQTPMTLRDGGDIAPEVLDALAAGGLFLEDQLEMPASLTQQPREHGSRPLTRRVSLDGLAVDQATPALATALAWAEGAFGDHVHAAPLAVTAHSTARMLGHQPLWAGGGEQSRTPSPVFAFFDSVEGAFVELKPEHVLQATKATTPVSKATESQRPSRRGAVSKELGATPGTHPARRAVTASRRDASRPVATGLNHIVPPRAGHARPALQPFTRGVFPTPVPEGVSSGDGGAGAPRFATRTVVDARGRSIPGVQRGAMSAPRVSVMSPSGWADADTLAPGERGETGLTPQWIAAADGGPDLPLAATLSRHEAMVGAITAQRTVPSSTMESFVPVVASPFAEAERRPQPLPQDQALDGVVWLTIPADEGSPPAGPELRPMSVVPRGRMASMVPASTAMASALQADALVRRAASSPHDMEMDERGRAVLQDGLQAPTPGSLGGTLHAFATSGLVMTPGHVASTITNTRSLLEPTVASEMATSVWRAGAEPGVDGALAEAVSAHWANGSGLSDAVETWSPRASAVASTDVGGGIYASGHYGLDLEMVRPAAEEEMPSGVRTSRRQLTPVSADPKTRTRSMAHPPSERTSARIQATSDARDATGHTPVAESELTMAPGPGTNSAMSPEQTAGARVARRSLMRPVQTAREVMALASFAGPSESPPSPSLGLAVSHGGGAVPSLVEQLMAARESGAQATRAAVMTAPGAPFLSSLAALTPMESGRLGSALRQAGWHESELEMLRLSSVPGAEGQAREGVAALPQSGQTGALLEPADRTGSLLEPADSVGADTRPMGRAQTSSDASEDDASTRRMTRNLARILTGTEALSGPGSTAEQAGIAGVSIESLLGDTRPFTASTKTERYFASNAPGRGRARWSVDLRDAVGELVALAEASSRAGGAVSPEVYRAASARVRALHTVLGQEAGSGVLDSVSGFGLESATTGRLLRDRDTDMVGELMTDRGVFTPSVVADFEASERGRTPASGYEVLSTTELPMLDVDEEREPVGLSGRIERALAESATGPAGVERLVRSIGFGAEPTGTIGEQITAVPLGAVMAPEAMLSGMRTESFGRPPVTSRRRARRGDTPGELTELSRSVEQGDSTRLARGLGDQQVEASKAPLAEARQSRLEASRRVIEALSRVGVGESSVDSGLLHGLMSRLQETATGGSLRRGEIADFTMAWLDRVDGSRTGLDIGMGELQSDVIQAVGAWSTKRRSSQLAGQSPIEDAPTVSLPGQEAHGADRSGLRRATRRAFTGATGAARPRHRAAAAVQQADWKFVDTGSRATTPHADLGQLAARIMETSPLAGEAPMPLVAPAVKAVAQTALRKGREESMGGDGASTGGDASVSPASGQTGSPPDAGKLSKVAFEKLAYEMADRVARRLKREQERKGQWP